MTLIVLVFKAQTWMGTSAVYSHTAKNGWLETKSLDKDL